MTDNEIIKALECCKDSPSYEYCSECLYGECTSKKGCLGELLEDAIDFISRQKAEIEELKAINESLKTDRPFLVEISRSEARKEFAERLKQEKIYSLERHEYIIPVSVMDWTLQKMRGNHEQ